MSMETKPRARTLLPAGLVSPGRIAWWIASTALLVLAIKHLPDRNLWGIFDHANIAFIALALASTAGNTLAKALRWRRLLSAADHCVPLARLLRAVIIGQMLNWIAPVRIGDIGRVYLLGNDAPKPLLTAATIAVEKLLDVIAYGLIALVVLLSVPIPAWLASPLQLLVFAGGTMMFVVIILIRSRHQVVEILLWQKSSGRWRWVHERLGTLTTGMEGFAGLGDRQDRWAVAGWSAVIWITAITNNVLVMQAIDLVMPWPAALLLLVGLQAGITLPSLPGSVGVFEYVCVASLAVWGVQQSIALRYAVLLHSVVMFPPVLVGAALWLFNHRGKSTGQTMPQREATEQHDVQPTAVVVPAQRVEVLGVEIDPVDSTELIEVVSMWCQRRESRSIMYVNAHCLNLAATNLAYRAAVSRADLVYPDGVGVVLAGRVLHGARLHKSTGADWIDPFCARAARAGWRIYILAGQPGVAQAAQQIMQHRYPELLIVGTCDGFFQRTSEAAVVREIAAAKADVLFVGMNSPRQEQWIDRSRMHFPGTLCWSVGALFDYVADRESRAPAWMRASGLEWFWRLLIDPRGKWRRYLLGNPVFVMRVLRQKARSML
ncbi:MAG: hypothetical protein NVS2B7_04030 [Herpetosiphon sp.]